jgi:ABC-type polysaccharide/polyol phosphate export permease
VVESSNTVLFWLVPIFYSFAMVRPQYREIYLYNPLAAIVMITRTILLDGMPPERSTLIKLTLSSVFMMVAGLAFFRLKKQRFYDYL